MCKGLATLPATCLKSAKDIKHKISFLLQKPEPQASDQKQTKEKNAAAAAAAAVVKRAQTGTEVKKWKESFSHVMSSDMGRRVFSSFLRSEFSEENMDFWLACEEFKKSGPSNLGSRAQQIYRQYVEADASNEVNLDAATREETRLNVENACPSCFDEAQRKIYVLMEKDSYRRFLISKLIQDVSQNKDVKNCVQDAQALTGGA